LNQLQIQIFLVKKTFPQSNYDRHRRVGGGGISYFNGLFCPETNGKQQQEKQTGP
jgi:hypothetical protein